jgi:glutaminyl-peptide cyclotransferase
MRVLFCAALCLFTVNLGAQAKRAQPLDLHVNGIQAFQYAKEFAALGPRPVYSAGHKRAEDYLRSKFAHDDLQIDNFTASTPIGLVPMENFIVRFAGTERCLYVLASHYDTNYPFRNNGYVGANDGASTTGLLIEIANHARGRKLIGCGLWLVFFDGEEAIVDWSNSDSTYGSRHLAARWSSEGILPRIHAFILLDMIGDKDLNILRDQNSNPHLLDTIAAAAKNLHLQQYFFATQNEIGDDHVPFSQRGVPVADLIDFDYGPHNSYWHTPQDTIDKISPHSLQVVGDVVLETLRLLNEHK